MVVAHILNPSMQEAEAGGSLLVRGQPYRTGSKATEKLCLKKKQKKKNAFEIVFYGRRQYRILFNENNQAFKVFISHTRRAHYRNI